MKKTIFSAIIFFMIFMACEIDEASVSPFSGWWKFQYIKDVPSTGSENTENFPQEITDEDRNSDGINDIITRVVYMNFSQSGDIIRSHLFGHEVVVLLNVDTDGNSATPGIDIKTEGVSHCADMDTAFTVSGTAITFIDGGPGSGTGAAAFEDNLLTITINGSDGSYEEWNMAKMGASPINPENAEDRQCTENN